MKTDSFANCVHDAKIPPMNKLIDTKLEVVSLARKNAQITGEYPLSKVAQKTGKIAQDDTAVKLKLKFYSVDEGFDILQIEWKTVATFQCERCFNPLELPLSASSSLAVCKDIKQAKELPDDLEPLILDEEGMMSLEQLLVEEIMLNFPLVPRHDTSSCSAKSMAHGDIQDDTTYRPFADLELNFTELGDK